MLLIALCFSISSASFAQTVEVIANKTNTAGYYGDGYGALDANLNFVSASVYDSYGNLFVVDKNNTVIRKIDIYGVITTFAGQYTPGANFSIASGTKNARNCNLPNMQGIAIDDNDNVYITTDYRICKITPDQTVSVIAGTGNPLPYQGTGFFANTVNMNPSSITLDKVTMMLYFLDGVRIRRLDILAGRVYDFAGTGLASTTLQMQLYNTARNTSLTSPLWGEICYYNGTVYFNDNNYIYGFSTNPAALTFMVSNGSQLKNMRGLIIDAVGSIFTSGDLGTPNTLHL